MADILHWSGLTVLPETPKNLLKKASKWGMERCIVIGYDKDNKMILGGSFSEAADIVMLLEMAKQFVLNNNIAREN